MPAAFDVGEEDALGSAVRARGTAQVTQRPAALLLHGHVGGTLAIQVKVEAGGGHEARSLTVQHMRLGADGGMLPKLERSIP